MIRGFRAFGFGLSSVGFRVQASGCGALSVGLPAALGAKFGLGV